MFSRIMGDTLIYFCIRQSVDIKRWRPRINNEFNALLLLDIRLSSMKSSIIIQILKVINNINSPIDIIIDDGSHIGEHQVFSFIVLNKYLSPNGIYVIEDIQPQYIDRFKDLSIFSKDYKEYILTHFKIRIYDNDF